MPDPRSDDDEDVYESRPDRRHDPPEPDDDENDPLCWKFFSEQGTDAGADSNPLVWSRLLGRADDHDVRCEVAETSENVEVWV